MMWKKKNRIVLPPDVDAECVELCDTLNALPGTETIESCCGHGKRPYWVFFRCTNVATLSRLGRAVAKNYSDGNWEIVLDSSDRSPRGRFWLRSKTVLEGDALEESLKGLIASIGYWFDDKFDSYFDRKKR